MNKGIPMIRTVSTVAAMFLAIILVLNSSVAFGQDRQMDFTDLDRSHWAYEKIMKMAQAGMIAGYPDGSFRPDATVTHGEFIRMATVAAGLSSVTAKQGEHWALPYYNTGINNFLFTRHDISEIHLDKPINRAHMALIASEIIKDKAQWENYSEILERIEDVDYRTQYEHHIVRAYGAGILAGYPDGTFRPFDTLNRAEAAAVIQRLQDYLIEDGGQEAAETDPGSEIISEILSEEELSESERDTRIPLIDTEPFDTAAPEGTFMARLREFHINQWEKEAELKQILRQRFPKEGEAIFDAFISFSKMDSGGKDLGICKQYVMGYPVLINLIGDGYDIMVFPKDYQDEYWETEPGQVNVFFI
ncbi:MAG TPA: S-layer homology domain-containing protein [Bacillota bacterium]|nr:S-layer homology domain-containing protein [Bacillota bacterium]